MTGRTTQTESRGGKSAAFLAIGLVAGTALGLGLGGIGWFSRSGETNPQTSAQGTNAVTFQDGAPIQGEGGATLDALLDPRQAADLDHTRKVHAFVDGLAPGDLASRIDAVFAGRQGQQGYVLINALYQKWVETDPAAALRHAESLKGRDRRSALGAVLAAWGTKEPYEVIAWMEEHGESAETRGGLYAALRAIARTDPMAALELAGRSKSLSTSNIDPGFIFGIWAEDDPQAAAAQALLIANSQQRGNALRSIALQWAYKDPQAVWDWGNGLERPRDRDGVLQGVIGTVVGDGDTSRAIAFLEGMAPGDARRSALNQIVSSMMLEDAEAAYEFARGQIGSAVDNQVISSLLYQWARIDPARAFEVALNDLDPGNSRNSAIQTILSEVANRDVAMAREMLKKLDPEAMENSLYSVAGALARNNVADALAWAEALPEGNARRTATTNVLSEWAEEDPVKASAYGLQLKDEELRRQSLNSVLNRWGNSDAVAAMTWAVENLEAKEQASFIPNSILGNWVNQDVTAAAEWVAALPEGELRKQSVSRVVSGWSRHDLAATGDWLNKLKPGESRDEAAQQYSSQVFEIDPEAALIWAGSIRKEETRLQQVENLARQYLRKDPAKARRWIEGSSLPAEEREQLLREAEGK